SVFFFSSRRRHTRFSRDWSSDVCSSDLIWRGLMLGNDDVLRADLIQQLMCQGEIDTRQVERAYDIRFGEYFSDALAALRPLQDRSEERRVGKEGRQRAWAGAYINS